RAPAAPRPADLAERRSYTLVMIAVTLALTLPILFTAYVPLVDYPNHLTRAWLLANYDRLPWIRAAYETVPGLTPNMVMDVIVPPLVGPLGLVAAGKAFLVLLVMLFAFACHRLGRALHGRESWLAVPAAFLVYNSNFLYGFVNSVFGTAMFAVTLAYWLEWRHRWTALRLVGTSALVVATFATHLGAYAMLGVAFGAITGVEFLTRRRRFGLALLDALPLVPSLLYFVTFVRGNGEPGWVTWNSALGKAIALAAPLRSYSVALDAAVCLTVAVTLTLAVRRSPSVTVQVAALSGAAALGLAFLATPREIFTSGGADARFVVPAALLAGLALSFRLPRRVGAALLGVAVAAGTVRTAAIWHVWRGLEVEAARGMALLDRVPVGTRLYAATFPSADIAQGKLDRSFEHLPVLAVATRQATVPTLFAHRGQQPLIFRYPPRRYKSPPPVTPDVTREYDHIWTYRAPSAVRDTLLQSSTPVATSGAFVLWEVRDRAQHGTRQTAAP
ncbi:MAG: hypothetical protein AVDCRST_MAG11-2740, partial [uncultured Gemmatimonadaceae bacterium]